LLCFVTFLSYVHFSCDFSMSENVKRSRESSGESDAEDVLVLSQCRLPVERPVPGQIGVKAVRKKRKKKKLRGPGECF
jgi:hypothetical protein